ncbi:MAG: cytochrome b/b6 domain-containing protein [Pseudomonadota bacterium]|nr:cytochrome b/b6 domain-containing protein [Pseudomonadota bacterium]
MNNEIIHRRLVWAGKLRLAHWLLAVSTFILMATGWLIPVAPSIIAVTVDWHYLAAAVFIAALVLRLWLLISDRQSAGIASLMPGKEVLPAMGQMLRFYITLGKAPLPAWYAHNPLWKPVYLIAILVMLLLTASGLLMDDHPVIFNLYIPDLHSTLATIFSIFVVLHIATVFMHDAKGTGSDISAMVNGHRIFVVSQAGSQPVEKTQRVDLQDFGKKYSD